MLQADNGLHDKQFVFVCVYRKMSHHTLVLSEADSVGGLGEGADKKILTLFSRPRRLPGEPVRM